MRADTGRATVFNIALLMDSAAAALPCGIYFHGACLLILKLFPLPPSATPGLAAGAAGVVTIALLAADMAVRRKWFDEKYALAWLDLHNRAGGAIIAAERHGRPAVNVRPRVSFRHVAKRIALPVLFVLAAWTVPVPERRDAAVISGAGFEKAMAAVEREVAAAEEDNLLATPDAAELRRQIARLRELAGTDPEAAAEAVRGLPPRVDSAMARRMNLGADALEKAMDLAESPGEPGGNNNNAEDYAERSDSLRDALDRLAHNEGGRDRLPEDIREAAEKLSGGAANREALESVMAALGGEGARVSRAHAGKSGASGRSAVLSQAGERLRSAGERLRAMKAGPSANGQTADGQEVGSGLDRTRFTTASAVDGQTADGREAGSGGVGRGRGDAPLVFGREARDDGSGYAYNPLPEGDGGFPRVLLRRDREQLDGPTPPDEFVRPRRSGASAGAEVHAGMRTAGLGPERVRAAERYFRSLSGKTDF